MADSVLYIYQTCDVLTSALPIRGYSERYKPLSASHSVPRKIKWVRKRVQMVSISANLHSTAFFGDVLRVKSYSFGCTFDSRERICECRTAFCFEWAMLTSHGSLHRLLLLVWTRNM